MSGESGPEESRLGESRPEKSGFSLKPIRGIILPTRRDGWNERFDGFCGIETMLRREG